MYMYIAEKQNKKSQIVKLINDSQSVPVFAIKYSDVILYTKYIGKLRLDKLLLAM